MKITSWPSFDLWQKLMFQRYELEAILADDAKGKSVPETKKIWVCSSGSSYQAFSEMPYCYRHSGTWKTGHGHDPFLTDSDLKMIGIEPPEFGECVMYEIQARKVKAKRNDVIHTDNDRNAGWDQVYSTDAGQQIERGGDAEFGNIPAGCNVKMSLEHFTKHIKEMAARLGVSIEAHVNVDESGYLTKVSGNKVSIKKSPDTTKNCMGPS